LNSPRVDGHDIQLTSLLWPGRQVAHQPNFRDEKSGRPPAEAAWNLKPSGIWSVTANMLAGALPGLVTLTT